jgi:hypothetical protein
MLAETLLRGRVELAYTHGPPNLGEHQRDDLVQRNPASATADGVSESSAKRRR